MKRYKKLLGEDPILTDVQRLEKTMDLRIPTDWTNCQIFEYSDDTIPKINLEVKLYVLQY